MINELDELARKFGTDKMCNLSGENIYHSYTSKYYELLKDWKNDKFNLLEIGIQDAKSHRMWHDFFVNAQIYGIDLQLPLLTNLEAYDRLHLIKCDQSDGGLLEDLFNRISFKVIVDDGSHNCWDQMKSFYYLWNKLEFGGLYFIEDIACAFDRRFREFDDWGSSTIAWLQSMATEEPKSYYIPTETLKEFREEMEYIHQNNELIIIKKKEK
jgi:hypothetical protein